MNNEDITICFKNSFETINLNNCITGISNSLIKPCFFCLNLSSLQSSRLISSLSVSFWDDDTYFTQELWLSYAALAKSGSRRGEKNESWGLARTHARPAQAHSTCYSMAGSTWRKNTNFHAFMASKKSLNFQIIFNITCLYWAARSSQSVSSKCQTGIGKPFMTQIQSRDSERNDAILGILRILFDVKEGSQGSEDDPINGTRTLERRRDHVGANWSLVWKEFLWANLRILFTACKHCRDLET